MKGLCEKMKEKYYIGLDIGGTKCAMTLGTIAADRIQVVQKEKFPTDNQPPERILERFCIFIDAQLERYEICGIGIACGGPLDSKNGIVMRPPSLPLWDGIPVVDYFQSKYAIPTYLQNDANACAVAEWKYGAGQGCENMIFLTFGTGLGAGLVLNNRLYSGTNDNAGEIGHIRLTYGGPVGYNKAGSCEGYCSGSGIGRLARILAQKEQRKGHIPRVVQEHGEENLTAKLLAEYAREGDPFALQVYKKSGEMFGRTLAILVDLFNPQRIVVGGVFMRSSDLLLPYALRVLKKESLSYARSVCQIVPAGLGEQIGDFSALSVAKGDF